MNFQLASATLPLRVLVTNPLSRASKLIIFKILTGVIFGKWQLINLILLVYENEVELAEALKIELLVCSFTRTSSIVISSTLPSIADADVFCFMTNFPNPNLLDFNALETDGHFDTFYLLLKLANNFASRPPPQAKPSEEDLTSIRKKKEKGPKPIKPIFMTDGLVAVDILMTFSKIIPRDSIFCPTTVSSIAKTVLGEHLKVSCTSINHVYAWAANDKILHVEVVPPVIRDDPVIMEAGNFCAWPGIGSEMMEKLKIDRIYFSRFWLKKDFNEKVVALSSTNVYGPTYKAAEFAKAMNRVWNTRISEEGQNFYFNMGVISDGSLGTIKGLPYVFPLVLKGDSWTVDERFDETIYLQYEIKRMNATVKAHHTKLVRYCKRFLLDNVINEAFIPEDETWVYPFSVDEDTEETMTTANATQAGNIQDNESSSN